MFQDVNGDAEHISGANFTFGNNLKALFSSSKCVDFVSIPMSIPTDIIDVGSRGRGKGVLLQNRPSTRGLESKTHSVSIRTHRITISKMVSLQK